MGRIRDRGHDGGDIWRWVTLAKYVNENNWTKGAELGVWEGQTFKYLINNCPNLSMVGVDLYEAQPQNNGPEKWTPGENGHRWDHNTYFTHVKQFCQTTNGRATIIKDYCTEAAKTIEDESLDFVFIDADHSFKGVDEDITHWSPKVKKGGYIFGHDIHFDSVKQAVEKHFGNNYKTEDDFVWFVVKD